MHAPSLTCNPKLQLCRNKIPSVARPGRKLLVPWATSNNVGSTYDLPFAAFDEVMECPNLRNKLRPRPSPFITTNNFGGGFVSNEDRVAVTSLQLGSDENPNYYAGASNFPCPTANELNQEIKNADGSLEEVCMPLPSYALRAGARETIYFNPLETKIAIVTCGGLCPGVNDVVQGLVNKSLDYGVPEGNILGLRYGFEGFYNKHAKPIVLTKRGVEGIHLEGGSFLGTSRRPGGADLHRIVKQIDLWGIDVVFVIGGIGGNAGACALQAELEKSNVVCSVVGIPKSIDNDILLIDKCFGFDTAVEEAQRALLAAKVEASSAYRGVGMVKVMGRQSGFIAVNASMASGVVDICLIPEVPFTLKGDKGLLAYLEKLLNDKGHAVICLAEGAGQNLLQALSKEGKEIDSSGNRVVKDVATWLISEIKATMQVDMKYIDPGYIIRSIPATSNDRIYCKILAHNAVHAAFAGFTGVTSGLVNTHFVYLPIPAVIQAPRRVDPHGKQWNRLRASIRQPNFV